MDDIGSILDRTDSLEEARRCTGCDLLEEAQRTLMDQVCEGLKFLFCRLSYRSIVKELDLPRQIGIFLCEAL